MMTAKLFENGRSQAVRLPKECRFSGDGGVRQQGGGCRDSAAEEQPLVGLLDQFGYVHGGFYAEWARTARCAGA